MLVIISPSKQSLRLKLTERKRYSLVVVLRNPRARRADKLSQRVINNNPKLLPSTIMPVHTNKPGYFGKGSVEIGPAAGPGEGPIRRIAISSESLITQPFEGIKTVYDVLEYAARTHGTRRALGWRDIVDIHEEEKEVKKVVGGKEVTEKKKWKYFQLSD